LKITFEQVGGGQKTSILYEKRTGVLLWANTSFSSYFLEMVIEGYTPWESEPEEEIPKTSNFFKEFLPYLIIIIISIVVAGAFLGTSKLTPKLKKFNKYILIGIIAIASFTSFFVFTSSLDVKEVNKPQRVASDLTLIVDYGNGTLKIIEDFELTDYNTTAFDALIEWSEVEYKDYDEMGILVENIDGVKGNWRYSINGDFPGVSSDKYNLKNGDTIKWVFG